MRLKKLSHVIIRVREHKRFYLADSRMRCILSVNENTHLGKFLDNWFKNKSILMVKHFHLSDSKNLYFEHFNANKDDVWMLKCAKEIGARQWQVWRKAQDYLARGEVKELRKFLLPYYLASAIKNEFSSS